MTVLLLLVAVGVLPVACGGGTSGDETSSPSSPVPASPSSAAPSPAGTPAAGDRQAVTLRYAGTAQVELSVNGGPRIFIDVWDPNDLSAPPKAGDILLTTHKHDDHLVPEFQRSFPGRQLLVREGRLATKDAEIRSIAAGHNEGDPLKPKNGTDYIFIIDIGGLRIAHFGDIGQEAFTAAQLKALGKVDVAITQFDNPFSQMDVSNKKGFALMDQLEPRLIIPTHTSVDAAEYAETKWPLVWSEGPAVGITAAGLPKKTTMLMLGVEAASYADMVKATHVDW